MLVEGFGLPSLATLSMLCDDVVVLFFPCSRLVCLTACLSTRGQTDNLPRDEARDAGRLPHCFFFLFPSSSFADSQTRRLRGMLGAFLLVFFSCRLLFAT